MQNSVQYVSKDEAFMLLANAIIEVAAEDYQAMLCGKKFTNTNLEMTYKFFESDFYEMLTNLDGKKLRDRLETEVKELGYDYKKLLNLKMERRSVLWGYDTRKAYFARYYSREKQVF